MPWELKEPRVKNPRGGWRWTEFDKEVQASTPEGLADRISKMRRANNKDAGNPIQEIARELAVTDPWMVRHTPDTENPIRGSVDPFTKTVEQWTFSHLRNAEKFIHQLDAKNRKQVCRNCVHNKPLSHRSEEEESRYWRSLMIASRGECQNAEDLHACEFYKHDNRLAVHLESPHPQMNCCDGKAKPSPCWI